MNLQELLTSFGLSEDQIKQINSAVDVVISSKLSDKDGEMTKLQGDLDKANGELKPFKDKERNAQISSIVGDLTDEEKLPAAIKLADIQEDDEEDVIKEKVAKVIEENPFLGKTKVTDPAAAKTVTKKVQEVKKPEPKINDKLKNL